MGFISDLFGGDKASKGIKRGINEIKRLDIPGAEEFFVELDRMVELGEIEPEMAEAIFMEQTGLSDIDVDPRLREAQYGALDRYTELAEAEGLDDQAMAKLREARAIEDQRLRGDIEAIEQQAARQMGGVGMSGMAQANKLLAAQQSANRMSEGGFQAAAEAERRALEALAQQSRLGGEMESRQFSQDQAKAQAQDLINQFNVQQATRTQEQNIAAMNQAQRDNLARKYGIQEYNLGQSNLEKQQQAEAKRQEFEDARRRSETLADLKAGRGAAQTEERKGGLEGLGQAAGTAAAIFSMFSDEDVKENIEPINVDEFLNDVTGYKYNYKGDDEKMYGVMAQDVEKSNPSMVDEIDGIKTVDYGKAVPGMLAALENINTRLKDMEDE